MTVPTAVSYTATEINKVVLRNGNKNAGLECLRTQAARDALRRFAGRDNSVDAMATLVVNALTEEGYDLEGEIIAHLVRNGSEFTSWKLSPGTVVLLTQLLPQARGWAFGLIPKRLSPDRVELAKSHNSNDSFDQSTPNGLFNQMEGRPKRKEKINEEKKQRQGKSERVNQPVIISISSSSSDGAAAAAAVPEPKESARVPFRQRLKRKRGAANRNKPASDYELDIDELVLSALETDGSDNSKQAGDDDSIDSDEEMRPPLAKKPRSKRPNHHHPLKPKWVQGILHISMPSQSEEEELTSEDVEILENEPSFFVYPDSDRDSDYILVNQDVLVDEHILTFLGVEIKKLLGQGSNGTAWSGYLNNAGEYAMKFANQFHVLSDSPTLDDFDVSEINTDVFDESKISIGMGDATLGPKVYKTMYLPCLFFNDQEFDVSRKGDGDFEEPKVLEEVDPKNETRFVVRNAAHRPPKDGFVQLVVMERIDMSFDEWITRWTRLISNSKDGAYLTDAKDTGEKLRSLFAEAPRFEFFHLDCKPDNIAVRIEEAADLKARLRIKNIYFIDFGYSHCTRFAPGQLWPNAFGKFGWYKCGPRTKISSLAQEYDLLLLMIEIRRIFHLYFTKQNITQLKIMHDLLINSMENGLLTRHPTVSPRAYKEESYLLQTLVPTQWMTNDEAVAAVTLDMDLGES